MKETARIRPARGRSILFAPLPEEGHVLTTLSLARALAERGDEVRYLVPADLGDVVAAHGFESVPLFPDLFPPGFAAGQRKGLQSARTLRAVLRELRAIAAHSRKALDRWVDGTADRLLAELAPDLVLADSLSPFCALAARKAGIPALLLSTVVDNARRPGIPPVTSSRIPDGTLRSRLQIALDWQTTLLRKSIRNTWMKMAGIKEPLETVLEQLASQIGPPRPRVLRQTALAPTVDLPELVLYPKVLDFPGESRVNRHYVESAIDLDRRQPGFPWERLDASKQLIYCALGTQSARSSAAPRILAAVLAAVRGRDDWQLVIAVPHLDRLQLPETSPQTLLVEQAPQLELLARARLMVTHGGGGSVKEAVYFGVPMVVLPDMRDRFGMAARVTHHGLGVSLDPRQVTPEALANSFDQILRDAGMRDRLRALKAELRHLERERPSLAIIERHLAARPASVRELQPVGAGAEAFGLAGER